MSQVEAMHQPIQEVRPGETGGDGRSRARVLALLVLHAVGGSAVLYSYYAGMFGTSATGEALWGGVPEPLRPLYTLNMFLAAAGYFLFTPYLVFRLAQDSTEKESAARFRRILVCTLLVLGGSALWLPLTARFIDNPSDLLWLVVRVDLALVGVGALGWLAEVVSSTPVTRAGRRLAILGLLPFCLQTVLLDALIWPAFFPSVS